MKNSRSLPLCALASALFCTIPVLAQQPTPAVRIVNPINESQRVTLTHTVSPLANAANDRGAAPDGMLLDRIQLVLQRSPAQESALHQLLAEQNTPGSPNYHQWLTPQQFGAQFGPSDQDIATIESWLGSHGFTVTKVNPGKGTLEFSGSVGQLRGAFHTQIHQYAVNGETHFANANDPQIPTAIAPVIAGFSSLNNFHPRSYLRKLGEASFNPVTHQVKPSWTWSTIPYYVLAPSDYAVQYDLGPLYAAGTKGDGQTIAIINESNINVDLVNQFRSLFGLPVNPPQIVIDGNDPGVDGINNPDGPNNASGEAYLDVEWAGAVAPNAQVDLVIAADTAVSQGLVLAMERAVYSNIAPILSISFGNCEATLGAENSFLNGLWEQAAAQGQTVMVSTGDDGSAGCDNNQEYAVGGQAVSGFASTPYNVAVGGTDFYYSDYATGGASISNYWLATTSQLPALSLQKYVPEQPWNDSQYGLNIFNEYAVNGTTTISAGSGGASNAAICSSSYNGSNACTGNLSGYPKPAWQTGAGVPADGVRDLPDVSLFAANGDNESFYPTCAVDGDCQTAGLGSGDVVQISGVGGTSASTPSFAGIMALVNQKYGRQGQADNVLYALKTQFPAAFHDITAGTNSVPCNTTAVTDPFTGALLQPVDCIGVSGGGPSITDPTYGNATEGQIGTGSTPEYNAGAGYNLATGLGTVDANVLVTDWNKVTQPGASSTTLTVSPTTFTHGSNTTPVSINATVTGATPTGTVVLLTDSTEPGQQSQGVFPLTNGAYSNANLTTLPGGTYHIWAQYSGDTKNAVSTSSPPILLTVSPETPGINFNIYSPTSKNGYFTTNPSPGSSVDYGSQLILGAEVAPTSQLGNLQNCVINGINCSSLNYTQPTGTVTFTDNGTAINTAVVNATGDAEYNAAFAVGAHSVDATYNGDQSYNKVTASTESPAQGAITFTVVKDAPVMGMDASNQTTYNGQPAIIATQPTVFNFIVENGIQYDECNLDTFGQCMNGVFPVAIAPPTGTVAVASSPSGISGNVTLSAGVDPGTGAQVGIGTLTIPASTLTSGSYTVSMTYSGDGNYSGNAGNAVTQTFLVLTGGVPTTTTATMTGAISPNSTVTITGTVTGQTGDGAPTGGIIFFSSGNQIGSVGVTPGAGISSTFSAILSSQLLFQGANFITLQYTGDGNVYAPSEFTLTNPIANPLSDFTLVPNTTIVPISLTGGANSGADTINVSSVNGFNGTVNLTCKATSPLTCSFSSSNPALSNNSFTASTLTINVPAGASNGNYNVLVTGVDATGEFVHTLSITADVTGSGPAFTLTNSGNISVLQGATTGNTSTITVTPANGFTGTVNLACSVTTIPTGAASPVTCNIPSSVNVTSSTAVTATLTANSTATTTAGAYAITVTGTSGSISSPTVVNVTVNLPQDYTIANSGAITIAQGATTGNTSTVTVTPSGGLTGTVNLACSVTTQPAGATSPVTCNIPSSVNITSGAVTATLTANSTSTTTTGAYVITVTGTGPATHATTVNVTVNAAATPTFTIAATAPGTVSPGASPMSTVTVTGSGGYTGSVTLACTLNSGGPSNSAADTPSCAIGYTSGSSIALSGSTTSGTASATVTTHAAVADMVVPKFGNGKGPRGTLFGAGSGALLAVLLFFGIPARRRSWRSMLGILIALVALGALSSCGGGSNNGGGGTNPKDPGTAAGSYTFTITGTGSPAVTPAPTTTFTISVN